MAGRDRLVAGIKDALLAFPHKNIIARNILEGRGLGGLIRLALVYLYSILRGRRPALQVLLFADASEIDRICREAELYQPDVVLVDTVRLLPVAEEIRQRMPETRIVLDMDDLMSRRYREFVRLKAPLKLGFVQHLVPSSLVSPLSQNIFTQLVYRGEARGLFAAEQRGAEIADEVVLVSSREADLFRATTRPGTADTVTAIRPPAPFIRQDAPRPEGPFRFFSIGADRLLQNERTIAYLVDLWARRRPVAPLVIYGKMTKRWPQVANVSFAGFAPSLEDVYTPSSILLAPSFVQGGVKTKVIEAFGYGVPVIGTPTTFEGLDHTPPLVFTDISELEDFVCDIEAAGGRLQTAATAGHTFAMSQGSPEQFRLKWIDVLCSRTKHKAR